ncbi:type I polyketide synthase [Aquamicrobium sp. LC103]|uniref:type I polyketide synthase n=1 Tax=Aquamicrobium sp. LC103 TaxID=1120658 RepID=UPI0009E4C84D|nr:type I polyketide synthase [Aquamicrobium sp. LC103]TKT78146.1 type I polyketide synthase [Aquamicrobium sp. LC103]
MTGPVLAALRDARRRLEEHRRLEDERVAIVGMAGRFPGADDVDAFWRMLDEGRTGLRRLSDEELADAGMPADEDDYVPVWGGFDDPTGFDAGFFGYSPREAELLDPQQRVFLECAWSALEHAGYDSRRFPGRIGVYGGGALTDYLTHLRANSALSETVDPVQAALSNVNGMIAARTSYHLDLKGPSLGVQTTCSTSLVAVHMATRSLLAGECEMALAGGVCVGQPRPAGYVHKSEGIGSPDGVCRPFDADAQGTVFANGVGIVVLKRLSDARAAGDTVYGIILGSAVNNDGAAKVGLTAPSVAGQTAVIEAALAASGVEASSIGYVEAHGTATALGDPIELTALNRAYGPAFGQAGGSCALGSVKGNIGHIDAAAGVAGLIKTLLALRHGRIPATANFRSPNTACDFTAGPFRVVQEGMDWPRVAGRPRRAAVSSFGMGGTNAHVVIEEGPEEPRTATVEGLHVLPFSARTPQSLAAMREALARHLKENPALGLSDAAHTLQLGRRPMQERMACLARDPASAAASLMADGDEEVVTGKALPGEPGLVFMFSGQGTQHAGMARALYESDAAFKSAFDECMSLLPEGERLCGLIHRPTEADSEALNRTEWAQPALFAVEYALARSWMAKGLRPKALIGHSIGEYVAACLAGVFSLQDALRVVAERGRLMQACENGAMLAVSLSEAEARAAVADGVELAAVNAPRSSVLAGPLEAVRALAERFERRGLGSRMLRTSHAFHTSMMEPALETFAQVLASCTLSPPQIDLVSNVTGDWLTAELATDPGYWVRHAREPVLFSAGVSCLLDLSSPVFLEIGPGSTLTRLLRQQLHDGARAVASLPDPDARQADAGRHVLKALGQLWVAGVEIDWQALHGEGECRRIGLPTYAFERSSFWIPPAAMRDTADPQLRRPDVSTWFHQPVWKRRPAASRLVPEQKMRWLVFDDGALGAALGSLPDEIEAVFVQPGETFAERDGSYAIDPSSAEDHAAVLSDLARRGWRPDRIVGGFAIGGDTMRGEAAFAHAVALAQTLSGASERPVGLTLVTVGARQVIGTEALDPRSALLTGLLRVLPQEIAGLDCGIIDLDDAELSAGQPVAGLQDLLRRDGQDGGVTALRRGFGWTQEHEETPLEAASDIPALQAGATYLVAGDLVEGLGPVYADALVKQLGARVVLLGRPGLPSADEWDRWLASHSPQHGISQWIRRLRAIGAPGRDYMLFSGNLADAAWVKSALDEAQRSFGSIRGVFHTAAMGDRHHCPLGEIENEDYRGLFDMKIDGLRNLDACLADTPPEFFFVQSSLSTLAGGSGLAAYAAANAFLDAFVTERQAASSASWQAVNWDVCRNDTDTDSAGGMLANAIDPGEVWQVTRAMLANPQVARAVVTPFDLSHRLAASPLAQAASKSADTGRSDVKAAYVAPRDEYEQTVAAVMRDLLGVERIGATDNFFELGGHSLLAIQVVTQLRKRFGVELPMRALLFEAPTVEGIARVIRDAAVAAARERDTVAGLLDDIEAGHVSLAAPESV